MAVARADLVGSTSTFTLCIQQQEIWETREMICYVLAMGKQHLGPHVVVGYAIKIFGRAISLRHQITWHIRSAISDFLDSSGYSPALHKLLVDRWSSWQGLM